ncbi:MAG: Crp/Fnr family transcriptional regulator [Rhodoferax sp.]|nr:Crp/Fnr family transcriptional regulator [Rhodoferax sp.]
MKHNIDELGWPSLIDVQPAAGLIPISLRKQAERLDALAHETLFRTGDPVRYVYLVISGEARLVRLARNGSEAILQRSRGGFIAEASLDSRSYHCDAITTEPTTILLVPAATFRAALEEDPMFRRAWQSQLAKEVRKLRAQCERLSLNKAADRINHYIESEGVNGVLTLYQSRMSWAAELGLTHESLYRTLRRMQDDGVLDVDGARLVTKS